MKTDGGEAIRIRVIWKACLYLGVSAFVFFLVFCNLDGRLFWGDEAETAVLAKNVLKFGIPKVDDGVNLVTFNGGQLDASAGGIWTWSPWLQEYITAGSFAIFGPTTWAGRAPFALIGWLDVVLLGVVAWKIHRSHRVALASMILMGTSEIFLLHTRQCRYYWISVLGEILFVCGIHQLFTQKRRGIWIAAAALILQFYSNYIIAAANIPALIVLAWMLRTRGKRAVLDVAVIPGVLLAAALPWLVYAHPWVQAHAVGGENIFTKAWYYLREFNFHFLPLCFLLLPLLGWIPVRGGGQKNGLEVVPPWERFALVLLPLYLAVIVMVPGVFLRYLLPLLPVACLLAAGWVFRHVRWRALAFAVLAVQCITNAFPIATAYPFREFHQLRSPLLGYVAGITEPYEDRFTDVLKFLNEQSHPSETILTWDPELPIVFYTQLKVIDARFTGTAAMSRLPDWILPESASSVLKVMPVTLPDYCESHYAPIALDVHDSARGDNYPEPDYHRGQSTPKRAAFVIYKLKTGAQEKTAD